jgi:hydroxymethylpyrimidine/phosphomethylpyrimidine kinase
MSKRRSCRECERDYGHRTTPPEGYCSTQCAQASTVRRALERTGTVVVDAMVIPGHTTAFQPGDVLTSGGARYRVTAVRYETTLVHGHGQCTVLSLVSACVSS